MTLCNQIIARSIGCVLSISVSVPALSAGRVEIDPNGPFAKRAGVIMQDEEALPAGEKPVIGSAVIISPCRLISNYHVVFGKSVNVETGKTTIVKSRSQGHPVTFTHVLNGELNTVTAKVRAIGNYIKSDRGLLGDLVVLDLETCLDAKQYAQLDLSMAESDADVPKGALMTISAEQVIVAGEPKLKFFGEEGCISESVTPVDGLFIAKCQAIPGMSGSAVYEMGADGRWHWTGLSTQRGSAHQDTGRLVAINAKTIATFLKTKLGGDAAK